MKAESQNKEDTTFCVASIFLYRNDNQVKLSAFSASNRQIGLVSLVEIPYCAETAVSIYWESHRLIITLRPRRGKLVINDLGWKGGRKSAKHLDCVLCLPSYAAPWARATKNVKKPQSQMCESCKKAWFNIFVKQNRSIFGFSHTFDSEVCYCSK